MNLFCPPILRNKDLAEISSDRLHILPGHVEKLCIKLDQDLHLEIGPDRL
jgi:hypothetical protein